MKKLYWVNAIAVDNDHCNPWRMSIYDACLSLQEGIEVIEGMRSKYNILAAWIEESRGKVVYHRCYINSLGDIEPAKK